MIKAAIKIGAHMQHTMTQDMLKDYVLSSLEKHLAQEVAKQMIVDKQHDPMTDDITYTATVNVPSPVNTITVSGFNGTAAITGSTIRTIRANSVQEILRVVEYTKNGKITRVELQKYDEENDSWNKIPRVQIEE